MTSPDVGTGPEVLAFGPRPARLTPSRRLVIVLLVAVLAVVGAGVWWSLRSRATDGLSLSDLQDVYAGMVRADGTNDAAVLSRDQPRAEPGPISPESCRPLVETTLADQLPPAALDGVSTYWLGEGPSSAVSLFTLRYRDRAAAEDGYQAIEDSLGSCEGQSVTVGRDQGVVTATPVSYSNGVRAQLGYLITMASGDRYAISVLQYANTITWQFRLEFGTQQYEPYVAQRLMDSFLTQLRSVEELRR